MILRDQCVFIRYVRTDVEPGGSLEMWIYRGILKIFFMYKIINIEVKSIMVKGRDVTAKIKVWKHYLSYKTRGENYDVIRLISGLVAVQANCLE